MGLVGIVGLVVLVCPLIILLCIFFISSVHSNRSMVFDDPQFFYGLQVNSVHMNFDDPEEFDDPHVFDDPQGIKLEVRTLII